MKRRMLRITAASLLFWGLAGVTSLTAQSTVTFRVDMSAVKVDKDTIVGLRGSMAPLSWEASIPMKDINNDGIYTATVEFKDGKPGERVLYKYMLGKQWDNDRFGSGGNRVASLCGTEQALPVDTWNELDNFACEPMLENANGMEFGLWLYIIGDGIKRGLTPEAIAENFVGFWNNDEEWIGNPETYMYSEQVNSGRYPFGQFEILENKPGQVKYRYLKPYAQYLQNWGKDGQLMGVSEADMTAVYKAMMNMMMKKKGWSFDWIDDGNFATVTITENK